jgi:hypothetical protein
VSQNWHVYQLVWTPDSLTWKIDGVTTYSVTSGVPSTPMFLLIETALGGIAGGTIDDSTLPQTMLIDYVRVTPYTESLFTNQVPALILNTDGPMADYELGTLFQSSASDQITALRFWKDSNETGIHTGHIWDASGAILTSVTFLGETASGWQQPNLATPLPIVTKHRQYILRGNGAGFCDPDHEWPSQFNCRRKRPLRSTGAISRADF